jgi:hypothetical protein
MLNTNLYCYNSAMCDLWHIYNKNRFSCFLGLFKDLFLTGFVYIIASITI